MSLGKAWHVGRRIAGPPILVLASLDGVAACGTPHESQTKSDVAPDLDESPTEADAKAACSANLRFCSSGCVDTAHDPAHCGTCDHACSASEICDEGICRSSCPADRTVCGGSCRDLRWDPAHCGACERACEAGRVCSEGTCTFTCAGGATQCGEACVDVRNDPSNCGACGVACAKGATCVAGICTCPTPTPDVCDATCVDKKTDPKHCTACGKSCTNARCATVAYPLNGTDKPAVFATDCVQALGVGLGYSHACARVKIGTIEDVWCWGDNSKHQLGREFVTSDPVPGPVQRVDGPWALGQTAALTVGQAYTFAGNGNTGFASVWGDVPPTSTVATTYERARAWFSPSHKVGLGTTHLCWMERNSTSSPIFCTGRNDVGQLAQGDFGTHVWPYVKAPDWWPLGVGFGAGTIAANNDTTCAVADDKTGNHQVYCWGRRVTSGYVALPERISTTQASDVVVGGDHACLRDATTGAWACWGQNHKAQCGQSPAPTVVVPWTTSWTAPNLVAGVRFNCGLSSGKVYCWGDNSEGQLGDGSTDVYSVSARQVSGITGAVDLSASDAGACVAKDDGSVWCWGRQRNGRFGRAADGVHRTPVRIDFATAGGSK